MASSDVAIANLALTKIGDARITSLSENTKPAREVNAVYEMLRDKLQRRYVWRFCVTRTTLAAAVDTPAFGYDYQFPLPSDCMRVLQVGLYFPGVSLADYIGGPAADYSIEGRNVLSNDDGPLYLRYLARVTDPTQFDATFDDAFAALIAMNVAGALGQVSATKMQLIDAAYKDALREAITANAIENPPEQLADDTWLLARL
jgi:hypothetical protein